MVCLLVLPGCVRRTVSVGDTGSLPGLIAMTNTRGTGKPHKGAMSKIRAMGLKETALSLGAQSGLAARAHEINLQLARQARILDAVYDFNSLVLEHNVLPPVLIEGRNTLNLANTQSIRIANRTYRVLKQARFITTPPNWRQYIWMDYRKPEYPNQSLLPKTRAEKQLWRIYVTKGWRNGVEQANTILEESVARIKEDYVGMIMYRKLFAMNMVSAPYVSHTDLGVTGDANELRIDDRVLRITALPALNVNSKEWRAAVAKDDSALEQYKTMENLAQNAKIVITNKAWQPTIAPVG